MLTIHNGFLYYQESTPPHVISFLYYQESTPPHVIRVRKNIIVTPSDSISESNIIFWILKY